MTTDFNPALVQGNILRGYRRERVRYLVLCVNNAQQTRKWLGTLLDSSDTSSPDITTEVGWVERPAYCFNVSITYQGLTALQLPQESLDSFPSEFRVGMVARAVKLGDVGDSAPEHWHAPYNQPEKVHLILSIYADDEAQLDHVQQQVESSGAQAFDVLSSRDGAVFDGSTVHFGYRDNISQPRFQGVHDADQFPDSQPLAPLGTVLLGYPTASEGLRWRVPAPSEFWRNSTFNAYRVMAQDVAGFEAWLDDAAQQLASNPKIEQLLPKAAEAQWSAQQKTYQSSPESHWFARYRDTGFSRHDALRELVAALMCGRWRNGVPLALSAHTPFPETPVSLTNFDYPPDTGCPFSSHTRRCNPRGGHIVQRVANNTRRLVRRGIPYGPVYDPANPDDQERGLLGNFLSGNLGAQFEAVMCDWLNLGLQDPRVTGSNDPLLGANDSQHSWFDIPLPDGDRIRLHGLPRFVYTRGGAYTCIPGIDAIRYIAAL